MYYPTLLGCLAMLSLVRVRCIHDEVWDAWMQTQMQDAVWDAECRVRCMDAEWDPWIQSEIHGYSQFHDAKDVTRMLTLSVSWLCMLESFSVRSCPYDREDGFWQPQVYIFFFYVLQSKRKSDHLSTISIYQIYPNSHFSEIAGFTCSHLHSSCWSRTWIHIVRWVGSCGTYSCSKGGGTPW